MSIYQVIRIASGIGYKVHVVNASIVLRVIGIFPSEAEATAWIANDKQFRPARTPYRQDCLSEVMLGSR